MAATLAHLSAEILGSILDMVDSDSLIRLLILGNQALNSKLYSSVTRFEHAVEPTKLRKFSPKIIGHFSALTHISLAHEYRQQYPLHCIVSGIDLMSFPATLRSLELNFINGFFCLLETLPTSSDMKGFIPRLRTDLKPRFKHLERVTWSSHTSDWTSKWDFLPFAKDVCAFPLVLDPWPLEFRRIPLKQAVKFPSTTLSLLIEATGTETDTVKKLPNSLTNLSVEHSNGVDDAFLCALPSTLQHLKLFGTDIDGGYLDYTLASVSRFQQLSSLNVTLSLCNTALVRILPRALSEVCIETGDLEFESLAHFPALKVLTISFIAVSSSISGAKLNNIRHSSRYGLPDDFCPMMREVIAKLPRKLMRTNSELFQLVRPCDWDVFPREQFLGFDNPGISTPEVMLTPQHEPFIAKLPQNFSSAELSQGATLPLVSGLPIYLRYLRLDLYARTLGIKADIGYTEELEAARRHNEAVFETLSKRTPMLKELQLDVDDSFEFGHMRHFNVPLQRLEVTGERRTPKIRNIESDISGPFEFLRSLESLSIHTDIVDMTSNAIPRLLSACAQLTHLRIDEEIPIAYLSLLPPKLRELEVSIKTVDANTFKAVPRSLHRVDFCPELPFAPSRPEHVSLWKWEDLCLLPTQLRSVKLPMPPLDMNTAHVQKRVPGAFQDHILLDIERIGVQDSTRFTSLDEILKLERAARAAAVASSSAKNETDGCLQDSLPVPSRRNKRKAESSKALS